MNYLCLLSYLLTRVAKRKKQANTVRRLSLPEFTLDTAIRIARKEEEDGHDQTRPGRRPRTGIEAPRARPVRVRAYL